MVNNGHHHDDGSHDGAVPEHEVREQLPGSEESVLRRQRDEAVRLYTETSTTVDEIAARYGVSRQTVHRWIQAAGVPLRGGSGPRREPLALDSAPDPLMAYVQQLQGEVAAMRAEHQATLRLLDSLLAGIHEARGMAAADQLTQREWMRSVTQQLSDIQQRLPKE